MKAFIKLCMAVVFGGLFFESAYAKICEGFGPQTPRDISSKEGSNPVVFNEAPPHDKLNLCNIHFHKNAEHKGPGFSISAGKGTYGGFQCNQAEKLSEKQKSGKKVCGNVSPGDTVEVHWVFSSCDVKPGQGLGACLSDSCGNPQLRVETQVFVVVNDDSADDFMNYKYGMKKAAFHQPLALPSGSDPVTFLGSTTGPKYNAKTKCSPLQVTWSVRPQCNQLNINTLEKWCKNNPFEEKKAHGVRPLVTEPKLLSKIN